MNKIDKWLDAWNQELVDGYNKTWEKPTGDKKEDLRAKQRLNFAARFDYIELEKYLDAIRAAVADGDIENAVLLTARFQRKADECAIKISIPNMEKKARSSSTSHAAKSKMKMQPDVARKYVDAKLNANPHMSMKEACRQVAKKYLGSSNSWNAVKRSYDKV